MGRPEDDAVSDETVSSDSTVANLDDTIITVPDDSTIVSIPDDATITPEYNTLISAMLDNSVATAPNTSGVTVIESDVTVIESDDTIITIDEETQATLSRGIQLSGVELPAGEALTEGGAGDAGDTAPIVRFAVRENNGTKHQLLRPLVVGRMPRAPRTGTGAVELLVVPSPESQVSSTHAMIEALGDVVVVTDLRSTNGTRVNLAGRPSVLLAPGDSLTVGAGAVIDVGDGNRLEVLSLS